MKDTPPTPPPKPGLHLNIEDWMPYLEDDAVTETQKIELIETLWRIMLHFADLGWELDDIAESSGQSLDLTDLLRQAVLNSEDTSKTESEEV